MLRGGLVSVPSDPRLSFNIGKPGIRQRRKSTEFGEAGENQSKRESPDVREGRLRRANRWEDAREAPIRGPTDSSSCGTTAKPSRSQIPPWKTCAGAARLHRRGTRLPNVSFVCPLACSLKSLRDEITEQSGARRSRSSPGLEIADFAGCRGQERQIVTQERRRAIVRISTGKGAHEQAARPRPGAQFVQP